MLRQTLAGREPQAARHRRRRRRRHPTTSGRLTWPTWAALRNAFGELNVSVLQLWITYFSLGGNGGADHVATYLAGDGDGADAIDHDHIIGALNDMCFDRGLDHPLPYGTT